MRNACGKPQAMPPQIFRNDTYLGVSYSQKYTCALFTLCVVDITSKLARECAYLRCILYQRVLCFLYFL